MKPPYTPKFKSRFTAAEKGYFKSLVDQIRAKREKAAQEKTETV